ncbi:MAG: polymer-forming cytoskeletal protein [Saprospiraceae bacterium]|nr:polymer-forming cytoskeletal protein [Saprospiraceae bacterium]
MFNSKDSKKEATKTKTSATSSGPSGHALNSVVKGTVVEGSVQSASDFRVDGTIQGKLYCDAKVIIGPTGFVDGEIRCKNAVIEGKFEGTIKVSELLNVRESAKISGDVTTGKLIVNSGAEFNVTCTMGDAGIKRNNNPLANKGSQVGKAAKAGA